MEDSSRFSHRSRRVLTISAILIATVVVTASVYWIFYMPRNSPRVSVISDPIELSFALDKTEFAVGENISMNFILKNLSNTSLDVAFSSPTIGDSDVDNGMKGQFMIFGYLIEDENDTEVFRSSHTRTSLSVVWHLAIGPLEQRSQTVLWDQNLKYPDYQDLSSGEYSIRGMIPPTSRITINGGPAIVIETPSIAFTVK